MVQNNADIDSTDHSCINVSDMKGIVDILVPRSTTAVDHLPHRPILASPRSVQRVVGAITAMPETTLLKIGLSDWGALQTS